MCFRRSLTAATASLLLVLMAAPEARAEVAAETDAFGRYVRTSIFTHSALRQVKIWRVMRRSMSTVHHLNPTGDLHGDLYPFIAENPRDGRQPVVVWSRFNGSDYDLVWSRFRNGNWTPIDWLSQEFQPGDDTGAMISFDTTGRPYVSWWRDQNGVGTIYVSFLLVTRWAPPIQISDTNTDSRTPRLTPLPGSRMRVEYRTPTGFEARIIAWNGPTTITDDVNPVGQVSVTRNVGQRSGWPP